MNTYLKYALPTVIVGGAVAVFCFAQPVVVTPPAITVTPPAVVVAAPPAPVVVVAPDYYYWDGVEYIGVVGDQYYYLGPDNNWVICDDVRVHRFQSWEHDHPDWQARGTHNVRYHNMAMPPHAQPMHAAPPSEHANVPPTHVNPPAHVNAAPAEHVNPGHDNGGQHDDHGAHNGPPQ